MRHVHFPYARHSRVTPLFPVDVFTYAFDKPASTVVVVTNDPGLSPCLISLEARKHGVLLVTSSPSACVLPFQPSNVVEWEWCTNQIPDEDKETLGGPGMSTPRGPSPILSTRGEEISENLVHHITHSSSANSEPKAHSQQSPAPLFDQHLHNAKNLDVGEFPADAPKDLEVQQTVLVCGDNSGNSRPSSEDAHDTFEPKSEANPTPDGPGRMSCFISDAYMVEGKRIPASSSQTEGVRTTTPIQASGNSSQNLKISTMDADNRTDVLPTQSSLSGSAAAAAPRALLTVSDDNAKFEVLVGAIQDLATPDEKRASGTPLACRLVERDAEVFKKAAVSSFEEYLEMAVSAGVVSVEGPAGQEWVTLNTGTEMVSGLAAPTSKTCTSLLIAQTTVATAPRSLKAQSPAAPAFTPGATATALKFGALITALRSLKKQNRARPRRREITGALAVLNVDGAAYQKAGVSNLSKYLELAVSAGVVTRSKKCFVLNSTYE